jgi:hypothetical protein
MRVIEVNTQQYYSGILVPDLVSVKMALYAYWNGVSSASNATRAEQPGLTLMMMDIIQSDGNRFVDDLFDKIQQALTHRSQFSKSYDYDGAGRFLKTSVDVTKVAQGFIVKFNAAYVGNKAEADIAAYLGVSRSLYWSKVLVSLDAAQNDQFSIDLRPILGALKVGDFAVPDATEVARIIAAGDKEDWSSVIVRGGTVPLFEHNLCEVLLQIESISVASYYDQPFVADGPIVTGALRKAWEEGQGFEQPKLEIFVRSMLATDNGTLDLSVQDKMVNLTDMLGSRLSTLIGEKANSEA